MSQTAAYANDTLIQPQQYWGQQHPWVKIAAYKLGKQGDAACSLSHIASWQEKLLDVGLD